MWESTVEVTREAVVHAAPEHAWSLVSDSAAWSLRPGRFAFDVPQVIEAGRLRCWFVPLGKGLIFSVQEEREEIPGQVMSLRSRSTHPAGRQAFTLSVQPHDRGATVRLTVTVTGPREDKADYQAFWRKELKAWLSALADVAVEQQVAVAEEVLRAAVVEDRHRVPRARQREGDPIAEVRLDAPGDDVDARSLGREDEEDPVCAG